MKVTREYEGLRDFETWQGATNTKDKILEYGLEDEFDILLEEVFNGEATETEINDFLWFDDEMIFEALGMSLDTDDTEC